MRAYDVIKHKRDGGELSKEQIRFFVDGLVKGSIPDYQVSALLMAIYFRGMTDSETAELTFAIRDSGDKLDIKVDGLKADKHSTGGVGDKTSLVVMPIVASCGIKVAKMSGRGLGHTGGTVDKLESIQGFDCALSADEFSKTVSEIGLSITGQSGNLAPADKILYALRDVTATVDSIPLIASSIMGKKLAVGDDVIVLDVKCGSGAFMKSYGDSERLASACVNIGKAAGKRISALITDMDVPLGNAIGNSLEVIEAIEALKGSGPSDLVELSVALAAEILHLSGQGSLIECEQRAREQIQSGKALDVFAQMVESQGGNKEWVFDTAFFPKAKHTVSVIADKSGYIEKVNAENYGIAASLLGAGRSKADESIDHTAGIIIRKRVGDFVNKGDEIASLQFNNGNVDQAIKLISESTILSHVPPKKRLLLLGRIGFAPKEKQ